MTSWAMLMMMGFLYLREAGRIEMHGWKALVKVMRRRLLMAWLRRLRKLGLNLYIKVLIKEENEIIMKMAIISNRKMINNKMKMTINHIKEVEYNKYHNQNNNRTKTNNLNYNN